MERITIKVFEEKKSEIFKTNECITCACDGTNCTCNTHCSCDMVCQCEWNT